MPRLPLALIALNLSAIAAAQPNAVPPRLPVERFALQPALSQPILSPDGQWVAARAKVGEKNLLIAYPFNEPTREKRINLGDRTVEAVRWAGSRRLLLTVRSRVLLYGIPLPALRLVAVDLATGAVSLLDPKSRGLLAGDVLYTDPAGGWAIVASQNDILTMPSVKRIDLATGAVTVVQPPRKDIWDWYADAQGNVRFGVSYDGDKWKVWYRATPDGPLEKVGSGNRRKDESGTVDSLRFTTTPGKGLMVTNGPTGRFAAYAYDLNTGAVGTPIYEHPEVDLDSVLIDAQGAVTGLTYEDDRARVHWIDPAMRQAQATIDRTLAGASNTVVSASTDMNRLLIWSGTASDPGQFHLYDRAAKRIDVFAEPFQRTDVASFAPVKPVRYTSRDGLTIRGYLTLPRGRPEKNLPLIMLPHGGPFARDRWEFDPYVQFLANRGYAVLQPNFRGSTGYGKEFVERGYGQWGRAMQDDVDDGVDWLAKQGIVDAKRVCIMGISYGGYAALWGAIRNPERYRCAVSLAGVTDLPGMLKYDRRAFGAPRYYREWERKVQGEEKRDLTVVSPLAQVARLKIPVFIAHGEKDTNVPPTQGHQMVDALKKAGAPVTSAFYKEAGHGLTKREDTIDFLTRLDAFLAQHNPG